MKRLLINVEDILQMRNIGIALENPQTFNKCSQRNCKKVVKINPHWESTTTPYLLYSLKTNSTCSVSCNGVININHILWILTSAPIPVIYSLCNIFNTTMNPKLAHPLWMPHVNAIDLESVHAVLHYLEQIFTKKTVCCVKNRQNFC